LGLFGKVIIPYEESLEALIQVPSDAVGRTYIFLAQQWEPSGQPGYAGGSIVYASSVSFVEVRALIDEETFWDSFELWSEEDAEEIRENIRRAKGFRAGLLFASL